MTSKKTVKASPSDSSRNKVPKARCIAVIGDIIGSRNLGSQRSNAQKSLVIILDKLNTNYRDEILARFTVTAGDEFQGLLNYAEPIPDLIWELEGNLKYQIRLGIGCGRLSTPLQPDSIGMDGPVWHAARDAIIDSYINKKHGGVFRNFGESDDQILNGFARILSHHRKRLTLRQLRIINLLRAGLNQVEVADQLRITRQAVSRHALQASWSAYEEANAGWKAALRSYDFRKYWK